MAVVRILEKDGGKPLTGLATHVAGHSLGEYSALAAAGALQLADAARLLKLRGQSMQKAVPVGVGAMAALLGIELEPAQEACKEAAQGEVVAVANDNGGGQVVVSGHKDAVERAIEAAKATGRQARHAAAGERALPLPADAAGRRRDEGRARDGDARRRRACRWSPMCWPPRSPIPTAIKQRLVEQVTGLVRWRESVQYMKSAGRRDAGRVRLRQGAVRPGQAHRQGHDRPGAQHAGRHRSLPEDGV